MATGKANGHFVMMPHRTVNGKKMAPWHAVFIPAGAHHVEKGHPKLQGKRVKPDHKLPEQWQKEAKDAGVNPDHLHHLAAELRAHDHEYVESINSMLKRARDLARKDPDRFGSLSHLSGALRHGDMTKVKGINLLASQLAGEYPEIFIGHHEGQEESHHGARENSGAISAEERLYDLLREGNHKPMTRDESYEQALQHLHLHASAKTKRSKPVFTDAVPFSSTPASVAAILSNHRGPLPGDSLLAGIPFSPASQPPPITAASVLSTKEIDRILAERADLVAGKRTIPADQRPAVAGKPELSPEEVDRILDERKKMPAWGDRYRR